MSTKKLFAAALISSAMTAAFILATISMVGRVTVDANRAKADWTHRSLDDQYRTAVHEAGHVIGGCATRADLDIKEVWVAVYKDPDSSIVGLTVGNEAKNPSTDADTIWSLGGGAAEKVVYEADPVLDSIDSDTTDDSLIDVCAKDGACGVCPDASKVGGTCMLNGMVLQKHALQFDRAVSLLGANKETLVGLANLIMRQPVKNRRRTLSRSQLRAFLASHPLVAPKDLPDLKLDVCK